MTQMKFIILTVILIALVIISGCTKAAPPTDNSELSKTKITILKTSGCGCCGIYSQYAQKQGLDVTIKIDDNLDSIKDGYKIPLDMRSCHTTQIENYFVEGHVPIEAIEKMMVEQPDIAGIALPGMPSGAPGMPGSKSGTWTVYAINHDGSTFEFIKI
ncbi:hypothetical protein COV12_03380 [Candidatus Woesearchaeota archaeon CG10_big_fil_rev_8_21_14_0_10_32_24]|nr:MAG: hypothetical protein COV12_03380 [Candidatus Woesearchaeota archaeon CG10_big_fil_rev_8_21_14_0_10_32_24]